MDLGDAAGRFRFLVRDRDAKFTACFDAMVRGRRYRDLEIPPRAPRGNAYAERWVLTVRTECLDWILIWNDQHLHRVLTAYLEHYNTARPHRGLELDVPVPAGATGVATGRGPCADIERVDVLGGLIHQYRRAG